MPNWPFANWTICSSLASALLVTTATSAPSGLTASASGFGPTSTVAEIAGARKDPVAGRQVGNQRPSFRPLTQTFGHEGRLSIRRRLEDLGCGGDRELALMSGVLDLAVVHPPSEHPDLSMEALPDEPLILALPSDHPLAAKEVIPISRLDGEPLVVAPRRIGPSIFDRMIALFRAEVVTPRIVQEVTPMTTLTGLVAAGVGMGFVTKGILRIEHPGVVFRVVEPEAPTLPVAAAWLGELQPNARRFLEVVMELGKGMPA